MTRMPTEFGDRRDRIDHDGATYIWEQVAEDVAEDITAGELPPNGKLPGEVQLAEVYGVSRVTIRAAVASLRKRGMLLVVHGRGTFVAPRDQWTEPGVKG